MLVSDHNGPSSNPASVLFFLIFLELEFYFFRNNKRMQYFAYFFIIRIVLICVREFSLQSTIAYSNLLIEN